MLHSLGKVTVPTPGTPVPATNNQSSATAWVGCNGIMIEAWWQNTGKIYVCDRANAVASTGVGILAILAPPTTNFIPSFSATLPYAPAGLAANQIWIDAEIANEGAVISYVTG